jgi:Hypoxia induced protein conserved region
VRRITTVANSSYEVRVPGVRPFESPRAKISAALMTVRGYNMDMFLVVIVAAMLVTAGTLFLGLLTMAGGGTTNDELSTRFMWARVGAQTLTILLLVTAVLLR